MMRNVTIAVGLAVLWAGGAGAAAAQQPSRMGGRRGGGPGGRPRLDPAVLEGAPDPDFIIGRFDLTDDQAARYRQLRDSFMVATEPQRDSAKAALQAMREAFGAGDRDAARQQGGALRHCADYLGQRQKEFEATLKGLLNSDQWKAYQEWREDQKRQAKERPPHG